MKLTTIDAAGHSSCRWHLLMGKENVSIMRKGRETKNKKLKMNFDVADVVYQLIEFIVAICMIRATSH